MEHNESLERAKEMYANCNLFPELKESEEERIRKSLIDMLIAWLEKQRDKEYALKSSKDEDVRKFVECIEKEAKAYEFNLPNRSYDIYAFAKDILYWLEKQGEQKPVDKVEPKFKVGDWAVSNLDGNARQISEVHFDEYNRYYVVDGKSVNLEEYDRLHHLWTTQDAKPGDVLSYREGQWLFIYKGKVTEDTFKYYALLSEKGITVNDAAFNLLTSCIIPATKEQCELLFTKMKENGYEWDIDTKELKKIEQKTANKIEPIFNVGDKIQYSKGCGTIMTIEKIENGEYIFANNMGHTTIEWGNKWYLVNPVEQKLDWSEEDCNRISSIKYLLHELDNYNFDNWLDSLKDRVQPKPRQEWSEEDKYNLSDIEAMIHTMKGDGLNADRLINWLKSLRPQKHEECSIDKAIEWLNDTFFFYDNSSGRGEDYEIVTHDFDSMEDMFKSFKEAVSQNRWKPSDEQMDALHDAAVYVDKSMFPYSKGILMKLYKQLKKL